MNINDRELLARTLQAEAGNQGYGGMLAAGSVIMNRANASGYGDGLRGVILKPGQFSAWNSATGYAGGEQGQDMANMRASDEAYKAADDLISGGYEDVTGGATHYYNPAISQPKWGQKAGGDWKQIGDHVFGFADAKKKPNPNQAIASDTMRVLGKQPKGLLATAQATDDTESKMIPEEKPKGLLGSLGIQKMVEGAEGEAGQRFYQRDTFKDTAAQMAPLLAAMGSSPALQKATAGIAAQRTEEKARNKSLEFLAGLPNGEEFVRIAEVAGPKAAMQAYLESKKAPKDTSTSAMRNYSEYQRILAEKGPEDAKQFLSTIKSGTTINTGDRGANEFIKAQMKKQADQYSAYSDGAMAAQDALGNLSIMEQLASQPGFYSGTLADRVVQVKKAAVAMGADPDLVKNEESFNAIAKKTALDVMGGSLGVGFSNADRDFVTSMVPGLENTQAGNAEIINIQRKLQQRRIDLAVLSDQYSTENGNLTGFTKFIKEWAEENPLFPKAQSKAPSGGGKQRVWDQSLNNGSGGFR